MEYSRMATNEVREWERTMAKRPKLITRYAKGLQTRWNHLIPQKVHEVMTEAIKQMVQAVITGSKYVKKQPTTVYLTLKEKDDALTRAAKRYRKTAAWEGAGTGAGGLILGTADFPLLLSIKMTFLYEAAAIYGFDTEKKSERLFLLYVFHLTYSKDHVRHEALEKIKRWDTSYAASIDEALFDWQTFQIEYRDTIDLAKLMQLIPGFGAIVGAWANYHFLNKLGENVKNAYRLRLLAL